MNSSATTVKPERANGSDRLECALEVDSARPQSRVILLAHGHVSEAPTEDCCICSRIVEKVSYFDNTEQLGLSSAYIHVIHIRKT